ncbi:DNA recombination protein RmuC [Arenibaculum pallidiluteum]|uniref:DNA recombination protein RmuC n=1 Tax=Arenibaculum pallidiluteum TaxID=2812559 RepID=UPI001A957F72|nr:DNA recombination protein RmuC [Arenibaculum pallidiluteum]
MPFGLDQTTLDQTTLGLAALGGLAGLLLGWLLTYVAMARSAEAERLRLFAEIDLAERGAEATRAELAERQRQAELDRAELLRLTARSAELAALLERERVQSAERAVLLERAEARLSDTFKALSAEALQANNQSFLELARTAMSAFQEHARNEMDKRQTAISDLVSPVRQSLEKVDQQIQAIEKERTGAYEGLRQQVAALLETQRELRSETGNLVRALRTPSARGRWGEMQLRRVVELAGMLDHCDFREQVQVESEAGRLRPDLVVRLPGGKSIVVDAKAPVEAYLDACMAAEEPARREALARHARHVREHMRQLGGKAYWDQFQDGPEFVVLFLPGENFFSAALEHDPGLIEAGIDNGVIVATPTTLIALLRAVAYGWRQEKLAQNARQISELGADLYKRLSDLGGHMDRLGGRLGEAVTSYNRAVGTLESRVLVSARRFRDLHAANGTELPEPEPIETAPRTLQAPELTAPEPTSAELTAAGRASGLTALAEG